jgi:CRISPR-associated endonuclease/helicase Cas3
VSLVDHLEHVKAQARAFARSHGLSNGVATDVVLAAAWHDAGKADPRFQLWLVEGDEVALTALPGPLAKSALKRGDRRRQREARQRAGYPRNARHELASVAMLEGCEAVLAQADDRELVLHLVASHHGWCRPYAPVEGAGEVVEIAWEHDGIHLAASSDHGQAHVGAGVVERFWKMTQKYGWWGLAWLEALVRLADHRASKAEQDDGGGA